MISLPKNIRVGLTGKKRKRVAAEKQRMQDAGQVWRNHQSISQGCHPSQIPVFRQFIKDHGLTDVRVSTRKGYGVLEFSSRRGMKAYAKATGQANFDET